jgi:protein disulfide-isomerase A1
MYQPFSSQVTIAKVDATANDVPDEIQGFPTIKLYAAGKKDSPIAYQGSRTVEDLAAFIKENGSHGIDVLSASEGASSDEDMATDMPKQAPAATESAEEGGVTESVKSAASKAAEKVKSAISDDEGEADVHDEL